MKRIILFGLVLLLVLVYGAMFSHGADAGYDNLVNNLKRNKAGAWAEE